MRLPIRIGEADPNINPLKLQHIATKNRIRSAFTAKMDYCEKITIGEVVAIINDVKWEDCTVPIDENRPE